MASVTVWPQFGTTVTLEDGITVIDADGRVLVATEEVNGLIRGGQLLTYDPRVEPTTGPDTGPSGHALEHILDGVQEIDGQRLSLGDFLPSTIGYEPSLDDLVAPYSDLKMLVAHLNGIAIALYNLAINAGAEADFGNYYSPVAAYLLSGANKTTDRSGNGHTLSVVGTPQEAQSHVAGVTCTRLTSTAYYTCGDAALNLTGAMSVEALINAESGTGVLAGWGGSGETAATNITWSVGSGGSSNNLGGVEWEHGGGVNDSSAAAYAFLAPGSWIHLVHTRSALGRFRTYINGVMVYEVTGLTMPTDGSSGVMNLGGAVGGSTVRTHLATHYGIYDQELTAAQVLDLAQKRLAVRAA
jgi:hypothetical protein